jgi:hypothetical protein
VLPENREKAVDLIDKVMAELEKQIKRTEIAANQCN